MVQQTGDNKFGVAKWIVAPTLSQGATHTTIAAALTSSSSGETIFIRPGTYTENLTLKAGVDICSFVDEGQTPNVTIAGTLSASFAGTCTVAGIRLQTNSANILSITGISATIVNLMDCYIDATNNTAISNTSSSSSVKLNMHRCIGDLGTTGIAYFTWTGGTFLFEYCSLRNTGVSSTSSTITNSASGSINFCNFNAPITTSDTTSLSVFQSNFFGSNATITFNGTGTNRVLLTRMETGSNSSISVGASVTAFVTNSTFATTNTNVITGSGTVKYTNLSYYDTGVAINTSTSTALPTGPKFLTDSATISGIASGKVITTTTGGLLQGTVPITEALGGTNQTTYTTGDLLYASASNTLSKRAIGSSGNVLTVSGGVPTWAAPAAAGGMTLLSAQTASNVANIDFTSISVGTYRTYLLIYRDVVPATDDASLVLRTSTDNGSSFATTGYRAGIQYLNFDGTSASPADASNSTFLYLTTQLDNATSTSTGNGSVYIYINDAALPHIAGNFSSDHNTASSNYAGTVWGTASASDANAFRVLMSSGNITQGRFLLFGIQES